MPSENNASHNTFEDLTVADFKSNRRIILNPTEEMLKAEYTNPLRALIPKCYTNLPKPNIKMSEFHEETLFYIFYNDANLQAFAYKSLIERGYHFHEKLRVFLKFSGPKTADDSRRKISYFDVHLWTRDVMEVVFDKEFLLGLKSE